MFENIYSDIKLFYDNFINILGLSNMKKGIFVLLGGFIFFALCFCRVYAATTTSNIDSGSVRPPGGVGSSSQAVSSQYSTVNIPSQAVLNQQYASTYIPACPANPVCPDINGKLPAGQTADCPDFCTVSRSVNEYTVLGVTTIASTTAPACPAPYVIVDTYQVGKEIAQNSNPAPAPYPISDYTLFVGYVLSGYTCTTYPAGTHTQCGFSFGAIVMPPWPNSWPSVLVTGYLGYYTADNSNSDYCKLAPYCTYYCDHNYVATDTLYSYSYSYLKCTPPPGLFYTGSTVPTAFVCAARKAAWQKGN